MDSSKNHVLDQIFQFQVIQSSPGTQNRQCSKFHKIPSDILNSVKDFFWNFSAICGSFGSSGGLQKFGFVEEKTLHSSPLIPQRIPSKFQVLSCFSLKDESCPISLVCSFQANPFGRKINMHIIDSCSSFEGLLMVKT